MAKDSRGDAASKKVRRAAQTAGQRDKSFFDRAGFASIVALICVLGIGLVAFAKVARTNDEGIQNQGEWHAMYAIWDCSANDGAGEYLPPFDETDSSGTHVLANGIMSVNPKESTLGDFFTDVGATVTDTEMTFPSGTTLKNGTDCDGKEADLEVRKWPFSWEVDSNEPEVFTSQFSDIPFSNDGEVYQVVLAPKDAEVPAIPQSTFDALEAATSGDSDTGTDSPSSDDSDG